MDTDAPEVLDTQPVSGATMVRTDRVVIRFSEHVDRQSFASSLHISPIPAVPPVIEWSGRVVTVQFPTELEAGRTWVFSIGSEVKDRNAGNTMRESHTVAFSTGDSIDQGMIRGRISDQKPDGITVLAYALSGRDADTIDAARIAPDYAVQSGRDGGFEFRNIMPGPYRLVAIRDRRKNLRYDAEADDYGVPSFEPVEATPEAPAVWMQLAVEDTTAPVTVGIEAESSTRVLLRLSETPDPDLHASMLSVTDSALGTSVTIGSIVPVSGKKHTWVLQLLDTLGTGRYRLRADSVRDAAGNSWTAHRSVIMFDGSQARDTSRPTLTEQIPASRSAGVDPSQPLRFWFSHPLRDGVRITLADSGAAPKPLDLSRVSMSVFSAAPVLMYGTAYVVCIDASTCRDSVRNVSMADTAHCFTFRTIAESDLGSLSGRVVREEDSASTPPAASSSENGSPSRGSAVIDTARRIDGRDSLRPAGARAPVIVRVRSATTSTVIRQTTAGDDGTYSIPRIPAGAYLLDAFEDRDANGRVSPGRPFPFSPSERFAAPSDTIRVRARWERADITLRLR